MLTLNNLTYANLNGHIYFKDLGLTLGDCSLVVLRANNALASSYLLEIIASIRKPSLGKILYANEDVTLKRYFAEYCEMVQYISEEDGLRENLTVMENLKFWATLKSSFQLVPSAISYFSLSDIMHKRVKDLNIIERKKTSLARLIASQSEIWLLDEPFIGLDEMASVQLAGLISARCEQGGIAIIAAKNEVPIKNYSEILIKDFR